MTEYIDKTEAMRRFKPFGREIPKDQVMAVLARIDEGIVRCSECKYCEVPNKKDLYAICNRHSIKFEPFEDDTRTHFFAWGGRSEGE